MHVLIKDVIEFTSYAAGIYLLIFAVHFLFHTFPNWTSFRKITEAFKGRLKITPWGGARCEFQYKSTTVRLQVIPDWGKCHEPCIVVEMFKKASFDARIVRKGKWAAFDKWLWGPYSESIQLGIPEFDKGFLIYTKDKVLAKNYLASNYVWQAIIRLFNQGWEDLYITPVRIEVQRHQSFAELLSLNESGPKNGTVFLEELSILAEHL